MTDRTKKTIYWSGFACAIAIFVAAFVIGLVGILQDIDVLIHVAIILVPCGLLVNLVNALVFRK